jgi:hypothetical protein
MIITKKALVLGSLLAIVVSVVAFISYFEFGHRYNFGHFVPYGLHVDVLSEEVSIGIPGQKKMYKAELSNFSFWPASLAACDYVTDAFGHGTEYPYAVQRWDNAAGSWQTIVEVNGEGFCQPMPLSTIETNLKSRLLWPGMYVEVMEGEATGAREPFQKGDEARFVVFRTVGKNADWQNAIASKSFVIEDDVIRGNGQFRVKH